MAADVASVGSALADASSSERRNRTASPKADPTEIALQRDFGRDDLIL
jgi:hypothetical protein